MRAGARAPETALMETPLGPFAVTWGDGGVTRAGWDGAPAAAGAPGPKLQRALDRFARWFAGDLEALRDLPLDLRGTPFQRRVWAAVRGVPPGAVVTYGALAVALGLAPGAARAVGAAVGRNPVAVVVPCHRVVGAGGQERGFAWGLWRKTALRAHEAGVATPNATRVRSSHPQRDTRPK